MAGTAVLMIAAIATSQAPTLTAIKAAFLYNFANFAEWPVDSLAAGQSILLCVVGDTAVADALRQTVKGRTIKGHEPIVAMIKVDGRIRECHLLYAGGHDAPRTAQLVQALEGAAVLTVSDGDRFAGLGGIAQLFVENDRMRFAINAAAAGRARIHLSSKLLNLAKMVKDEADVPR